MHPMTRTVAAEAVQSELRAATYDLASICSGRKDLPSILGQRSRWLEIRDLARDQIADDVENTSGPRRDRIGRATDDGFGTGWVGHDDVDSGLHLWRRWTPDQIALEAGLAVFLNRLSDRQREVLRLRYGGRLSVRQTAGVLGIRPGSAQVHEARGLEALRQMLLTAFVQEAAWPSASTT